MIEPKRSPAVPPCRPESIGDLLYVLRSDIRLEILTALVRQPGRTVTDLAEVIQRDPAQVSRNFGPLIDVGLLTMKRAKRYHLCYPGPAARIHRNGEAIVVRIIAADRAELRLTVNT